MEKKLEHKIYNTDSFFKSITSVEIKPVTELDCVQTQKTGDIYKWKLFGLIPVYKYAVDKCIFRNKKSHCTYEFSQDKELEYLDSYSSVFVKDGKVFSDAVVTIKRGDKYDYKHFDSDAKAEDYLNEIITKCKQVKNNLW